jgi:hemin uptake protein HemP
LTKNTKSETNTYNKDKTPTDARNVMSKYVLMTQSEIMISLSGKETRGL